MAVFEKEKACPDCGTPSSAFRFHVAGSEDCELAERSTEHTHRVCETCHHEWADPPPHIRQRDLPTWAKDAGPGDPG
jgi:hypothetical protein